jgi:hypothetical protein
MVGITGSTNTITASATNLIAGGTGNTMTTTTGTNTINATAANNVISAATTNAITGGTGNTVTATTGNNAINAVAGSNTITANAASQSNTLSATGVNGGNNLTANDTTGTNNIEAHTNNIGVATANSINTIGNTGAASTVTARGGTATLSVADDAASLGVTGGGSISADAFSATLSGTGPLATNGTNGILTGITGAISVYNSAQTIGENTTINNTLGGFTYQNKLNGNTFVDGNMYINGTLAYVSSNSASTTVIGGVETSKLSNATQGTSGGTAIVMKGTNGATESVASMTLTNGINVTNGLNIYEDRTLLSGGVTRSTIMTMSNSGAVINAQIGSNTISANAASQSNTLSATGVNGGNNLTANDTTGTNNIEAHTNNIGVATANSINTIGNTGTASTFTARGGNATLSVTNNAAILGITGGGSFDANANQASMGVSGGGSVTSYETVQTTPASGATGLVYGDAASQDTMRGAQYLNRIQGNTLVDGNMYINGTLAYTSNKSAITSVTSGQSILDSTESTAGQMSVVNKGETIQHAVISDNGRIVMTAGAAEQSTASVTLTNGLGNTHGVVITEAQTVLSGGTKSTSLTLDDSGATFRNDTTGGAAKVTGVANGTHPHDAVNYGQLQTAYSGIASVSALAAIPDPIQGKKCSVGLGYGSYMGEDAIALGLKGDVAENIRITTGLGFCRDRTTLSAGVGFSF